MFLRILWDATGTGALPRASKKPLVQEDALHDMGGCQNYGPFLGL